MAHCKPGSTIAYPLAPRLQPLIVREMSTEAEPPVEPSDRRLRLRFLLGAASLGGEWLAARLRSWDRQVHGAGLARPFPPTRRPTRHRLVGALVDLSGALRGPAAIDADEMRRGGPTRRLARLARGLQRSPARLRGRLRARLDRWESIGRTETAEARELARFGLGRTTQSAFEWLSDQPALRQMVAEQSMDLSRTMLDEVRDATQAVDERADSLIRRLLQRRHRSVPSAPPATAE